MLSGGRIHLLVTVVKGGLSESIRGGGSMRPGLIQFTLAVAGLEQVFLRGSPNSDVPRGLGVFGVALHLPGQSWYEFLVAGLGICVVLARRRATIHGKDKFEIGKEVDENDNEKKQ